MKVRGASPADEEWLVHAAVSMAHESEGAVLDDKTVRRGVKALLADPSKGRVFIAEKDGQPVGSTYVTFEWSDWHAKWYWWIQSAFVEKPHRGTGVWTALFQAILKAAKAQGDVRSIRLYVEGDNEQGLRAYRGHKMAELHYKVFEQVIA